MKKQTGVNAVGTRQMHDGKRVEGVKYRKSHCCKSVVVVMAWVQ